MQFYKNEPEKLLKTKGRLSKMGQNEPGNEPNKCFGISGCGKTNRRRKLVILLKINNALERMKHRKYLRIPGPFSVLNGYTGCHANGPRPFHYG